MTTLSDLFVSLDDIYPDDYIIRVVTADDDTIDGKTNKFGEVTFEPYGTFDCYDCDILYVYAENNKVVFEIDGKQIDFDSDGVQRNKNYPLNFYRLIMGE